MIILKEYTWISKSTVIFILVVYLMTDVTEMVKCMISFSLIICTVYYGVVMCDANILL
jgi:hypothetical protein